MKVKLLWVRQVIFLFFLTGFILPENLISKTNFSNGPGSLTSISPTRQILPGSNVQLETSVAKHPSDPLIMAASAITDVYPGGYTTGFYRTTNGGLNWSGTNAIKNLQGNIITTLGDPMVTINKNGNFVLTFNVLPQGTTTYKAAASYSTNNGLNWSGPELIPGVGTCDKLSSVADNSPASPFYGRVYAIYSDYAKMGVYFSYSSNGETAWDSVKRISPPFADPRVGASMTIGNAGELYVTWPFYDALSTHSYIGFAKSTDGGLTWSSNDTAIPVYVERLGFRLYLNNTRLNGLPVIKIDKSGGPDNGNLYVVCSEKTGAGSPSTDLQDIIIHKSTDQGNTWNSPVRVNQDNTGSLRIQCLPVLNIDDFGGVNVVYFDTRNTSTNDSCEVYLSRSIDGGNTFQDYLISENKFRPKYLTTNFYQVPGYIGSYIGITSSGRNITPVWFDNNTETFKAWTATVKFGMDVKSIPQGLYDMITGRLRMQDTVKVFLRDSDSPYSIIDSASGIVDSVTFIAGLIFPTAPSGDYYLEIRHKNSINTWSKYIVNYSTGTSLLYDFTITPNQAFGNNQIKLNNLFCTYSGDVNNDRRIDIHDVYDIYGELSGFEGDNSLLDVTGDGMVDLYDLNVTFNNSINFVICISP